MVTAQQMMLAHLTNALQSISPGPFNHLSVLPDKLVFWLVPWPDIELRPPPLTGSRSPTLTDRSLGWRPLDTEEVTVSHFTREDE